MKPLRPEQDPGGRVMPLFGTLSTMPLPDLLRWLADSGRSGTLQLERSKVSKWLVVEDGHVIGCSSSDPPERIGHFLLSRGIITEEQLRDGLNEQETRKAHLGRILVERGHLSESDLRSHLTAKSEETVFSAFDWDDGVFRFVEESSDVPNLMSVHMPIESILRRGTKRYTEMRSIREVFSDPGIVLDKTDRRPPKEVFDNTMASRIYEAVNGRRTVGEILLIAHGSEYLVTKFLHELHRMRFLEIVGLRGEEETPEACWESPAAEGSVAESGAPEATDRTEAGSETGPAPLDAPSRLDGSLPLDATGPTLPRAAPLTSGAAAAPAAALAEMPETVEVTAESRPRHEQPAPTSQPAPAAANDELPDPAAFESHVAAARTLVSHGDPDAALVILDRLYEFRPEDQALLRVIAEAEAAFIEMAYRHYLPPASVPVLTRSMDDLESENLSPSEFFLLSRIDGSWNIKAIIQVTPLREVEALRTLKRMVECGIITVTQRG